MNRIRERRQAISMTQDELASASGIGQTAISRYESDTMEPTGPRLVLLARALGCSVDYLLGVTDDPRPYRDLKELTAAERALLKAWHEHDLMAVLRVLVGAGNG